MTQEMETKVGHTPTPWRIHLMSPISQGHCEGQNSFDYYSVLVGSAAADPSEDVTLASFESWTAGKNGGWPKVADPAECLANAEYACLAVNSHAALVEACQAALECLCDGTEDDGTDDVRRILRAALEAAGITP